MDLKKTIKYFLPRYQKLVLEYKVDMKPRYSQSRPHKQLYDTINKQRADYLLHLEQMLALQSVFNSIKRSGEQPDINQPVWNNGFLPGLDIVALYFYVKLFAPRTYLEIGSGNSTMVVRKCITDNSLFTKIISVDPFPRASIDHLSDEVIRKPLENVEDIPALVDRLQKGDILFIDNSHRVFPNSDAMVCFMEVLPRLRPGVVVHIHDIYLPYDYPQDMCDRFYSEQYVLAAFLLANPEKYKVIFPAYFVSADKALAGAIEPLWQHENTQGVEKHGGSFWFRVGE
jgi:hypothetical protein